jgi:release factor glutamine methyltransferase
MEPAVLCRKPLTQSPLPVNHSPKTLLTEIRDTLRRAGIENADNEARWLLEETPNPEPGTRNPELQSRVARRCAGEPLQYILGTVDFLGLTLKIGPGVLIPRPETEYLAEIAIEIDRSDGEICDVCTGSGAIALALAAAHPDTPVTGIDISEKALEYARKNREICELRNLRLIQSDLFTALKPAPRFSLITANPPYIAPDEFETLPADVRDYEPREALLAEDRGLAIIRRLFDQARRFLLPGGHILCEIGETQHRDVLRIMQEFGYTEPRIEKDLVDRYRIAVARAK